MTRAKIGAVAMAVAMLAAACGGDDATDTTTTAPATTSSTASTSSSSTTTLPATTTTTTSGLTATATTLVVQQDLTALGYFTGAIDGIAGDETRSAIASFQADVGIEADGEFGPNTDAAMVPLLEADKPYVEQLQEDLTDLEMYTGPIDGDFGRGTVAAVEKLQESCELEVTGSIDIATRICVAGL
ncbi:MAG: peptidoglycan-binding domain-containing protein [Acidimicrobiia bacterium]